MCGENCFTTEHNLYDKDGQQPEVWTFQTISWKRREAEALNSKLPQPNAI